MGGSKQKGTRKGPKRKTDISFRISLFAATIVPCATWFNRSTSFQLKWSIQQHLSKAQGLRIPSSCLRCTHSRPTQHIRQVYRLAFFAIKGRIDASYCKEGLNSIMSNPSISSKSDQEKLALILRSKIFYFNQYADLWGVYRGEHSQGNSTQIDRLFSHRRRRTPPVWARRRCPIRTTGQFAPQYSTSCRGPRSLVCGTQRPHRAGEDRSDTK